MHTAITDRSFRLAVSAMWQLIALIAAASLPWAAQAAVENPADLVLLHGHIITVDANDTVAQALAVKDGGIMSVGSDRDVQSMVGPQTRVIDLHGRAVTPGLIDSHAHFMDTGLSALFEIELSDATSIAYRLTIPCGSRTPPAITESPTRRHSASRRSPRRLPNPSPA